MVLIALGLGVGYGYLSYKDKSLPQLSRIVRHRIGLASSATGSPGQWGIYEASSGSPHLTREQKEEVVRLRSLGYAGGTVRSDSPGGVTVHQPGAASAGLRFFTSGHMPGAFLMDPKGRILHTWRMTYDDAIAQCGDKGRRFLPDTKDVTACWRRAHLFPDGEMLAIFEGHGLVKIDRDSKLIWGYPGTCHHDLEVAPDGSIYVLTRETEIVPEIDTHKPVLVDYITHLSAQGEFLGSVDLLEAFRNSIYTSCLDHLSAGGDIFHSNTIEVLDGKAAHVSPVFARGNFLVSLREPGIIAIVDHKTEKVVWALSGMWSAQHQPTMLENGHILLFDNQGHEGRSKVIEIDPFTQEVVWSYADSPAHPLYSRTCGSCERLPNGNTLITESDNGRTLETTPGGEIVWEFRNPRRSGENQEFIAAILEMVVLPDDYHPAWISLPQ